MMVAALEAKDRGEIPTKDTASASITINKDLATLHIVPYLLQMSSAASTE
jgi:hypothetical protein